jgi:hypothetical protein
MNSESQPNLSSKLENTFLGVLRIVILIVLSISIIGSLVFGIMGFSNLNATPAKYEYKDPNIKEMVSELNKSLEDKPSQSEPKASQENNKPKKNEKLDLELDKQVKQITEFLGRYNLVPNAEGIRSFLKRNAENLAFDPKNESSVVKYAEGQTAFFDKVFTNKDILTFFDKLDPSNFNRAYTPILDIYPDYFKEQRSEKKSFESEQNAEVMGQKAGAALYLYIAAGMFLAFLLISFILVLVKIERNLRVRTI